MKTDIPLNEDELWEWMGEKAEFYEANPLAEDPINIFARLYRYCVRTTATLRGRLD